MLYSSGVSNAVYCRMRWLHTGRRATGSPTGVRRISSVWLLGGSLRGRPCCTPCRPVHTASEAKTATCESESNATETEAPKPTGTSFRRSDWLGMDPLDRWQYLVELGHLSSLALLEGNSTNAKKSPNVLVSVGRRVASYWRAGASQLARVSKRKEERRVDLAQDHNSTLRDSAPLLMDGPFSSLPYSVRLHVCVSLLMWIRCLRDVQETITRMHQPYAETRRMTIARPLRVSSSSSSSASSSLLPSGQGGGTAIVADVFPTRLVERLIDPYATVAVCMTDERNSTAEQIPPPHTWNVAEALGTAESEMDYVLDTPPPMRKGTSSFARMTRRLGFRLAKQKPRKVESSYSALKRVQGIVPKASDDDVLAERVTRRSANPKRRERLVRQKLANATGNGSGAGQNLKGSVPVSQTICNNYFVSPLDPAPEEDARYHNNADRGEGCPLDEYGRCETTPIHISKETGLRGSGATVQKDRNVVDPNYVIRLCVMAHAAILSSLFVEGRTAAFTTDVVVVADYVRVVFADAIASEILSCRLTCNPRVSEGRSSDEVEPVVEWKPYFPDWVSRQVWVVLPPGAQHSTRSRLRSQLNNGESNAKGTPTYTPVVLRRMAQMIVRNAPCSVVVEGPSAGSNSNGTTPSYVEVLKKEVDVLIRQTQDRIAKTCGGLSGGFAANEEMWKVHWVPLAKCPSSDDGDRKCADSQQQSPHVASQSSSSEFKPRRNLNDSRNAPRSDNASSRGNDATHDAAAETTAHSQTNVSGSQFLESLQSVLPMFHSASFLYHPRQSAVSRQELQRYLCLKLPPAVFVAGVNANAVEEALYFFPHATFLPKKVGNAFRFRSANRVVVQRWRRLQIGSSAALTGRSRARDDVLCGVQNRLDIRDKADVIAAELTTHGRPLASHAAPTAHVTVNDGDSADSNDRLKATHSAWPDDLEAKEALLWERSVEYMGNPSKKSLFALIMARFIGV